MLSYLSKQDLKFLSNRNGKNVVQILVSNKLTIDRLAKDRVISISELLVERKKYKKVNGMFEAVEESRANAKENEIFRRAEHQKEKNYECKQMRAH